MRITHYLKTMGISTFLALCFFCLVPGLARAEEGGIQYYIPGVYSSLRMAAVPDKAGFIYLNLFIAADLEAEIIPSGGEVFAQVDVPIIANAFAGVWMTDKHIFGGRYFAAAAVIPMYFEVESTLVTPAGNQPFPTVYAAVTGDWFALPFGLAWHGENTDYFIYQGVSVPLGQYVVGDPKNGGLNHWVFDSNFALTWRIPKTKWEFDFNLGYTINTKNNDTEYKSGDSMHLDYTFGYNISEKFAVGLSGYAFKQIEGDSGSGATLGPFKGEAYGFGASLSYTFAGENLSHPVILTAEFITDTHVENRYEANWLSVQLVVPFMY